MNKFSFVAILLTAGLSSCIVSKKKFDEMLAQKIRAESELMDRSAKLSDSETSNRELTGKVQQLTQDSIRLISENDALNNRFNTLTSDYNQLNTYYKNLLNSSGKMNRDLSTQKEQLMAIQENLERTRKTNDSLSAGLAEREKKVKELETVLSQKDKAVKALKDQISGALLSFKESDLTVKVKNGKVYVSLAEQLLFQSGSIEVDSKGVSALQQLAKALKDQKGIQIMVEGHTDNVGMAKPIPYMQDNWDLSVLRATSITRILTKAGVSPMQITASGKGEFSPLIQNSTKENKQLNRRTEIIITPQLDELFRILENN
ncbi:MAG: OmpA family protein [Cyclobacteriaceae bacterium]